MKTTLFTFLLALGFVVSSIAQGKDLKVRYYISTDDYLADRLSIEEVQIETKDVGADYIHVKSIIDPATQKKSDDAAKPWAIQYEGKDYLNLRFSNGTVAKNLFIQVDLKGRFCLAVMDPAFTKVLDDAVHSSQMNINGMNHPVDGTIGGNFLDEQGVEKLIFLTDTKDLSIVLPYKAKNSPIDLLSKSTLKWLVGKENYTGSKKDYTVEDIIAIVEDLNRRQ